MSIIPIADKEAWDRFTFLANWHGDKFGETYPKYQEYLNFDV